MNAPIPSAALTTGLSLHASLHTLAEEAWSRLRGTLEALGPLAQTMDEGQVASYELAFVSAELHAMRAMLDYAGRCAEGPKPVLEERMALAFSADVITKVRQRFDRVRDAINLPGAPLIELFESDALRGFCREWLAPSALARWAAAFWKPANAAARYWTKTSKSLPPALPVYPLKSSPHWPSGFIAKTSPCRTNC